MPRNLLGRLDLSGVDLKELNSYIHSFYVRSGQAATDTITYGSDDRQDALRVKFKTDGTVIGIFKGPHFDDAVFQQIVERVQTDLVQSHGQAIIRRVVFCATPIKGAFRWKSDFQILPVPEHAPKPQWTFVGGNPGLLEVSYDITPNDTVASARRDHRMIEVQRTLYPLLRHPPKSQSMSTHAIWVLDFPYEVDRTTSVFRQTGYTYDGFRVLSDDFTPIDDLPQLAVIPQREYYERGGIPPGEEFAIPDSLHFDLECFARLSNDDRARFTRASFWLKYGREISTDSMSASFVAYISAIEALAGASRGEAKRCDTCNQPISDAATERFISFLKTYLPDVSKTTLSQFYGMRSDLTHGTDLFLNDETSHLWDVVANNERSRHIYLGNIILVAMRGWLRREAIKREFRSLTFTNASVAIPASSPQEEA